MAKHDLLQLLRPTLLKVNLRLFRDGLKSFILLCDRDPEIESTSHYLSLPVQLECIRYLFLILVVIKALFHCVERSGNQVLGSFEFEGVGFLVEAASLSAFLGEHGECIQALLGQDTVIVRDSLLLLGTLCIVTEKAIKDTSDCSSLIKLAHILSNLIFNYSCLLLLLFLLKELAPRGEVACHVPHFVLLFQELFSLLLLKSPSPRLVADHNPLLRLGSLDLLSSVLQLHDAIVMLAQPAKSISLVDTSHQGR